MPIVYDGRGSEVVEAEVQGLERRELMAMAIYTLLLLILFLALVIIIPNLLVQAPSERQMNTAATRQQFDASLETDRVRNEFRTIILQAIGGTIIVTGGVATWVNISLRRRRDDLDRVGQIAERFSRAVAQLDGEQEAVRIGAIHSLERIAFDSDSDVNPVADVLCAIVRQRARRSRRSPLISFLPGSDPIHLRHRTAEAQVALTILGRMDMHSRGVQLALYDCDLRKADLRDLDLSGARLGGSTLAGSAMSNARLVAARLVNVDLTNAIATHADFRDAVFWRANLARANLTSGNLVGADLSSADLRAASLDGCMYSRTTRWPPGFDPSSRGAQLVDFSD